ncbi:MAG: response regulator [Calditrichaeota bacterium]|nr:hypothetical protein [Calditrichota bacterium]RQW03861.1 MAG: response regulator [Calditrichota bacterium]
MRVVVYENTMDRAKLIRDLLSTYRYKTYINTDRQISLNSIKDIKPSLMIINVDNPSHMELLDKIQQNSQFNQIPVILISNVNSSGVLRKYNQLNHVDFLVEPFKIKNFRHMVERWITFRSVYVN